MKLSAPCSCGTGQPCPSHVSFGGLFDTSGILGGITLDQLASISLIALVGLQFYQYFTSNR